MKKVTAKLVMHREVVRMLIERESKTVVGQRDYCAAVTNPGSSCSGVVDPLGSFAPGK
jgi:hypothetical protein